MFIFKKKKQSPGHVQSAFKPTSEMGVGVGNLLFPPSLGSSLLFLPLQGKVGLQFPSWLGMMGVAAPALLWEVDRAYSIPPGWASNLGQRPAPDFMTSLAVAVERNIAVVK